MKPLTLGAGRFDVDVGSWTFGAGWECGPVSRGHGFKPVEVLNFSAFFTQLQKLRS